MAVHFTCPSLWDQDPDITRPSQPCPGHLDECQVLGTVIHTDPRDEEDE